MANYCATARSNYFRIKDAGAFKKWCQKRRLNSWIKDDRYAISPDETTETGWPRYDGDTDDEIDLELELSKHLDPSDIAVLMEIGSEKLRYLTGEAVAVSASGETCRVSLDDIYNHAIESFLAEHLTITEVAY